MSPLLISSRGSFSDIAVFISFCFSEINFQFYQESKIAVGETIAYGDTSSYIINENIFDLGPYKLEKLEKQTLLIKYLNILTHHHLENCDYYNNMLYSDCQ